MKVDPNIIHALELCHDRKFFDQDLNEESSFPVKDILKMICKDILAYEEYIIKMYDYPIGDPDGLEDLGKQRSIKHDKVIGDLSMLRRMCKKLSLGDPFCDDFNDDTLKERRNCAHIAFELLNIILKDN